MRTRIAGFVLLAALLTTSEANAQVPWEAPLMVGPGSPAGLSILLTDPGQGAGIGVFAHWQGRGQRSRVGYRIGLAEERRGDRDDRLAVFGGVDVSAPLLSHSQEFPLDLIWVAGIGAGFGDNALVSIPFGVSLGRALTSEGVWFHPYFTPRVVVDAYLGDNDRDDLDLGFVVDIGADFAFSGNWAVRFGASVGDRDGLAIGLTFPTGG